MPAEFHRFAADANDPWIPAGATTLSEAFHGNMTPDALAFLMQQDLASVSWYMLRDGRRVMAVAALETGIAEGKDAKIIYLGVPPALQGKGYASRLLRTLEEEARRRGAEQMVLNSTDEGQALYRGKGYEIQQSSKPPLPNSLPMHKSLNTPVAVKGAAADVSPAPGLKERVSTDIGHLEGLLAVMGVAQVMLDEAAQRASQIFEGSTQEAPTAVIGSLGQAQERLNQAVAQSDAAWQALRTYRSNL